MINKLNLEAMLEDTQFQCHEDPEEVERLMVYIDPEEHGFFNLAQWIDLMTFKMNNIEEDLVKSFKVFETNDDDGTVKRDELK